MILEDENPSRKFCNWFLVNSLLLVVTLWLLIQLNFLDITVDHDVQAGWFINHLTFKICMKDDINFTGNFTVENNLNLVMYA